MGSKFFKIKCKCGNEQTVFSSISTKVKCGACDELLANPEGGEATLFGKVVKVLG